MGTKKKNGRTVPNCVPNANEGVEEAISSLERVSTSNSGTGEFRGVNIPSELKHPEWREPAWSFQEIAQKLGIPVPALNLLAFKTIGGFPEAVPGIASRYGSKKYYKQSEVKRWVNANNVREKIKQSVKESDKIGNMDADQFDAAMARLKNLAGQGPMKTVWDPQKRVYKNVPVAVQPKQQPSK